MSMRNSVHGHMVSDRAAEEEESKKHEEADQNKQVEEDDELSPSASNVVPELSDSDIGDSSQEVEDRKLLAIKLVREAVEKILLPEVESESQSLTNDNVEELTEEKHQEGTKSPSKWSNLRKRVLLQRFVKELEKVRKMKQCSRQKKAEEWMLDYALQKVVMELAPTQTRKVALLVKPFETIAPPSLMPDEQESLRSEKPENAAMTSEGKVDARETENADVIGDVTSEVGKRVAMLVEAFEAVMK